jgi:hypothetical protein
MLKWLIVAKAIRTIILSHPICKATIKTVLYQYVNSSKQNNPEDVQKKEFNQLWRYFLS